MPYVDLAGLSRYASRQKDYLEREYALLRDMQWLGTDKAGAVSLWPVGGTPLKPAVDFLFIETGPAEGTKGPDNPSTITGVSSVKVTTAGRNLLNVFAGHTYTDDDITYELKENGSIVLRTIASTRDYNRYITLATYLYLPAGEKVFLSVKEGTSNSFLGLALQLVCLNEDGSQGQIIWQRLNNGIVGITIPKFARYNFRLYVAKDADFTAGISISPMAELLQNSGEWELPSGTVLYALPLGNTYYGGTLDVASGVMTVTWEAYKCTGSSSEGWFLDTANSTSTMNYFRGIPQITRMMGNVSAATRACTHFVYSSTSSVVPSFATWSQTPRIVFRLPLASFPDATALTSWLASEYNAGHPVTVAYALDQPYTVQLSPTKILSLTQTDKYTPRLNTVYTDAQAVQAGYVKSPIRDEYELQQAVIAQGGNV